MKRVIVRAFGEPDVLDIEPDDPGQPGPGQVRVALTSIGLNQADLMGRLGRYKASTGEPPYTPGIEGGGRVEAVGDAVTAVTPGDRVILAPTMPRGTDGPHGGSYRTHMVVPAEAVLHAPDAIPDDQLGAIWLPYLTAYGCLVWKHGIKPGDIVGIPACSSSVGLAAAQVAKQAGAITIGLTSSQDKVATLEALDTARFDHLIVTHDRGPDGERVMRPWHGDIKQATDGHGVDVYFDPVAAGDYLTTEVRTLAPGGRVYLYGLLGEPGPVDLQPLILKAGGVLSFILYELIAAGDRAWRSACEWLLDGFKRGAYQQRLAGTYPLDEVRRAHHEMAKGQHIGKLVLTP